MCSLGKTDNKDLTVSPKKGSLVLIYLEGEISNKPFGKKAKQTWFSVDLMPFILFGRKPGFMEALLGNAPSKRPYTSQPVPTTLGQLSG